MYELEMGTRVVIDSQTQYSIASDNTIGCIRDGIQRTREGKGV